MDDGRYMDMALGLAARGTGWTTPNPMVGAVVVKDGEIVGQGWHQKAGGPHAEVHALIDAGDRAAGATLYVTLEPCHHHGRTPPCTEKILAAGIRRVVMAMQDPNPDVRGGGGDYLRQHGVSVTSGIREAEARRLNERFIKFITTKRPFVTLKCAATLDGRIATRTGDSKWVTGPASRRYGHDLRHSHDAILVGVGTVKTDDPSLTARREPEKSKDPVRIILDTRLSIPETAKLLRLGSRSDTLIITGDSASSPRREALLKTGAKIMDADVRDGRIDLAALMPRLGAMGITSILVEGGATVAGAALRAKIVDKICFFYAPKILGGDDGVPLCAGPGPALMRESLLVNDIRVHRFDDDVMIEGYL